jgi:cytochrome b involved in lipid metabolism
MMRKLFIASTLFFWLVVIGVWLANFWLPPEQSSAPALPAEKGYALQEVARHNQQSDCWMAIGGAVYNFTAYLPQHPSDPAIFLPWCGKEATQAFATKTKGRAHSSYAEQLLPKYRIGKLSDARP